MNLVERAIRMVDEQSGGDLATGRRKLKKALGAIENRADDRRVLEMLNDAYTAINSSGGPQKVLDLVDDAIEQTERGGDEAMMLIDDALYHLDKVAESAGTRHEAIGRHGMGGPGDPSSETRDLAYKLARRVGASVAKQKNRSNKTIVTLEDDDGDRYPMTVEADPAGPGAWEFKVSVIDPSGNRHRLGSAERGSGEHAVDPFVDDLADVLGTTAESHTIGEATEIVDGLPPLPDQMRSETDAQQAVQFFRALSDRRDGDVYQAAHKLRRAFGTVADEFGAGEKWGPVIPGNTIDTIMRQFDEITRPMQKYVDGYNDRAFDDWTAAVIDDLENYRP